MREADGLDLLLGPSRRAAKCSGGDFGSLVGGMVLRIASAESIARNFGVPPSRIEAAIASAVILLLTGPAAR
jgi:hypothetical protein